MKKFLLLSYLLLNALLSSQVNASEERILRIGFQKSSTIFSILKAQGTLERQLASEGIKIQWYEFTSGLPLLEALNIGNIDLSADVADTVPTFALAAGAKVTFFAQELPSPTAQAIVVQPESSIKNIKDLKGKRVGVAKASGAHYLLVKALADNGMSLGDIDVAYLQPSDGRGAFEKRAIDAWAVWDPFLSSVLVQDKARTIVDGTKNGVNYRRYYLVSTLYATQNQAVLSKIFQLAKDTGTWIKKNPKEAATLQANTLGIEPSIIELSNKHRSYKVNKVDNKALGELQTIADTFFDDKILPKKINVFDSPVWH